MKIEASLTIKEFSDKKLRMILYRAFIQEFIDKYDHYYKYHELPIQALSKAIDVIVDVYYKDYIDDNINLKINTTLNKKKYKCIKQNIQQTAVDIIRKQIRNIFNQNERFFATNIAILPQYKEDADDWIHTFKKDYYVICVEDENQLRMIAFKKIKFSLK